MVDDISHEGLRVLLGEEGVSFQAVKTWKLSNDPDFEAKKNRILELYDIADGKIEPAHSDPTVVICVDEFGPLNLRPHPGRHWAAVGGIHTNRDRAPRRRRRATYTRPHGVRHLLGGYDLSTDRLYGHITKHKGRTEFLAFVRYLRSLHPPEVRIAIVIDNFSPHLSRPRISASAGGPQRTTSNWPTHRTTRRGSTGSRLSSKRCATSRSMAPITPATTSRPE